MTATIQVQMPSLTVGIAGAATLPGVVQDHIRNLIYKTKELKAGRVGNRIFIERSELERPAQG